MRGTGHPVRCWGVCEDESDLDSTFRRIPEKTVIEKEKSDSKILHLEKCEEIMLWGLGLGGVVEKLGGVSGLK